MQYIDELEQQNEQLQKKLADTQKLLEYTEKARKYKLQFSYTLIYVCSSKKDCSALRKDSVVNRFRVKKIMNEMKSICANASIDSFHDVIYEFTPLRIPTLTDIIKVAKEKDYTFGLHILIHGINQIYSNRDHFTFAPQSTGFDYQLESPFTTIKKTKSVSQRALTSWAI